MARQEGAIGILGNQKRPDITPRGYMTHPQDNRIWGAGLCWEGKGNCSPDLMPNWGNRGGISPVAQMATPCPLSSLSLLIILTCLERAQLCQAPHWWNHLPGGVGRVRLQAREGVAEGSE